ncbi:MAG: toxin-antitoxin system HicB family antitoxin [Nakamurella sp.]
MDLSIYTTELRENLAAAASLGDEPTQRAAGALAAALEPAGRLALMHALSDLAAEVTAQLADTDHPVGVDVRIDGRDLRVVTHRADRPGSSSSSSWSAADPAAGLAGSAAGATSTSAENEGHERTFAEAGGDLTRTTVRMFNELKGRAERAAAEQGVSLNSFISKAVAESIKTDLPRKWKDKQERHDRDAPREPRGSSITGYVQG